MVDDKITRLLAGKLRQPIHIDYISKYIVKKSIEETIQIIHVLVSQNILEESKYGKDYYVIKQQ